MPTSRAGLDRWAWRVLGSCLLLPLASCQPPVANQDGSVHVLDDSLKYITRPDIEAPRWNVTVYDRAALSEGYWFVSSYDYLDQSLQNGGRWTAPHIFDASGELVWSGAYLSQQYDVFDFRISNVLGEEMITMMYPHNRSAYVMDESFTIRDVVPIAYDNETVNMHDFQFVDNGTRVLYFFDRQRNMSLAESEEIGYTGGGCSIVENGFRELDVSREWERVFEWFAGDHIALEESTKTKFDVEERCLSEWDYTHVNSLDKFVDGSYLMSARHTDTIYRIASNGSIIWRLGGKQSDFVAHFNFSRQHHARIIEHNSSHTVLSFFDNAEREYNKEPTSYSSRGVIVALHTDVQPMTATLVQEYHHPDGPGSYTVGRANLQILPNGNAFACWVDGLLHSEYTVDGRLIMEARANQDWLKSYRSYKFPFTSHPSAPPDVYASTTEDIETGSLTTLIHVSWNGATEVARWNIYRTDETGDDRGAAPIASMPRTGFETALAYTGFATYIVAEALDHTGTPLFPRSNVTKTIINTIIPEEELTLETLWLQQSQSQQSSSSSSSSLWRDAWTPHAIASSVDNRPFVFFFGFISGLSLAFAYLCLDRTRRWRWIFCGGRGHFPYRLLSGGSSTHCKDPS